MSKSVARWFIWVILLAAARPVAAGRTEFFAMRDGQRLTGAEVCFFKGGDYDNVLAGFLTSQDVRCLPADDIIQMPSSNWNVYLTHEDGFVSAAPTFQTAGGNQSAAQVAAYRAIHLEMFAAATLDFERVLPTLRPGESVAVYLHNEGTGVFSSLRPLLTGHSRMLVPGGVTVVPLVVHDRMPRAAGHAIRPRAGETIVLEPIRREPGVIGTIKVVATSDIMQHLNSIEVPGPRLVLTRSDSHLVEPLLEPRPGAGAHRSLFVFGSVPPGKYTVESRTPTWSVNPLEIVVERSDEAVVAKEVKVWPTTPIEVVWSIDDRVIDSFASSCTEPVAAQRSVVPIVRVESCAGPGHSDCEPISEVPVPTHPPFAGVSRTSTRNPERIHRIVVAVPGDEMQVQLNVTPYVVNELIVDFAYAAVSGRVTSNGEGIRAKVFFKTGSGVSDALGRYSAIVDGDPGRGLITVTPCDAGESYLFQPDTEVMSGSMFDIELPDESIEVRVENPAGQPIAKARVVGTRLAGSRNPLNLEPDEDYFEFPTQTTDDSGFTELKFMSPDHKVKVCAHAEEYKSQCAQGIAAGASVTLTLPRKTVKRSGRIVSSEPLRGARLYWVDPGGAVTEVLNPASDGTFTCEIEHAREEYCVLVAAQMPLYVFRPSEHEYSTMVFELPPAQIIDMSVSLDAGATTDGGWMGMRVGSFQVPQEAFGIHQQRNGQQVEVRKDAPATVSRVALTGPIELLLLPRPLPKGTPNGVDWFIYPLTAPTVYRVAVTPGNPVVFR
jgi:hypothetical protein